VARSRRRIPAKARLKRYFLNPQRGGFMLACMGLCAAVAFLMWVMLADLAFRLNPIPARRRPESPGRHTWALTFSQARLFVGLR
jgi:hypothetical protein